MSKQNDIKNYIDTIVGATVTTSSLCTACKCTLPTVLTFIKENSHRFTKVKRGSYTILPAVAIITSTTSNNTLPTYEW